jgi:hypothetical protein
MSDTIVSQQAEDNEFYEPALRGMRKSFRQSCSKAFNAAADLGIGIRRLNESGRSREKARTLQLLANLNSDSGVTELFVHVHVVHVCCVGQLKLILPH